MTRSDSVRPPRLARALVAVVTPAIDRRFVLGDLDEEYVRLRVEAGWWAARSWYWRQALSAVRPGLSRRVSARPDTARSHPGRSILGVRGLGPDLRFAARRLRQAPLLVLVTAASLGLGIGATTTVFSVANGLLLSGSPAIDDPDDVLAIYTVTETEPIFGQTSFPDFLSLEQDATTLESVAAFRLGVVQLGERDTGRPVAVEIVTGRFFDVLGVRPSLGRFFTDQETLPGRAEHLAVVTHDFWIRHLGGASDVVGRSIRLDGQIFTIVGVGPEDLRSRLAEMNLAAWVPAGLPGGFYHATDAEISDRAARQYAVLARARSGLPVSQTEAELEVLARRLHVAHGEEWEDASGRPFGFRVVAGNPGVLPPEITMALGASAAVVLAFAGLILLVACSNVAGLLLAQAHERRQEIAVRAALGAGKGRLVRMLLAESALLALAGGFIGVVAARLTLARIGSVALPVGVPLEFDFGLDTRVLLFALAVSGIACLVFGLLPALAGARAELVTGLKSGTLGAGRAPLRMRRLLVVAQVTVSTVLLAGAGLVLRSTEGVLDGDLGFVPDRIAVVSKDLSFDGYAADDASIVFEDLAATIAAHPDVEAVALATNVEEVFDDLTIATVRAEPGPPGDEGLVRVRMNAVGPGYMSLLGLQAVRGRVLDERDRQGTERVVVVNEVFAAMHWPDQSPIGRTLRLDATESVGTLARDLDDLLTVVGVIRDPEGSPGAGREIGVPGLVGVNAKLWVPLAQHPSTRVVIHARARDRASAIVPVLQAETGLDDVPLIAAQPLEQLIALPLAVPRAIGRVMRWGGAFALVLSFLGIYGIVSFSVTARSREMAIRKAIGARSDQVIGRVMRQGVLLAVAGVVAGLAITVPLAILARSELATVHPLDPVALGTGVGVILLAALLASGIPARRLVRLDPMAVLRDE